ncbi:MAG: bifunctional oligoribonuclease/PAP phosphatase NrnA [Candidatus Doudnabacteria bacterium]|nr:bifunctional oligoribonuclease/PAP phosphatase NrnA [Candidatus Doudnabacteria bacterium]
MTNKINFKKALDLINRSEKIFLTMHEGPDGDDLGSVLAMFFFLNQIGKKPIACIKGEVPDNLKFLPGWENVSQEFPKNFDLDLAITFGCNKLERTNFKEMAEIKVPIINFDHHPDNSLFAGVNVVDADTSAVAELIYYFLDFADAEITKEIATCLLTGIFTDTGGFKHANTSAEALEVAAHLLKKGARIDKIAMQTMGKKRPSTIKAWAKGLENARFDPSNRMVFSVMTEEDLKEIGATDEDLDGFVELLNNMPQSKFALLLRQDGEVVRGSLRSEPHKKVDVSKIAKSFGGGGHKLASGFKIKGKLLRDGDAWKIS